MSPLTINGKLELWLPFDGTHASHEMDAASLETFEEIKPSLSSRRDEVVDAFRKLGGYAAAEQIADLLGRDKFHVMPRITELRKCGRVRKTGTRRRTRSDKSENVWQLIR